MAGSAILQCKEARTDDHSRLTFPELYRAKALKAIQSINLERIEAIAVLDEARLQGRHMFVCGNGGSATTDARFVCEIVKGARYKTFEPLPGRLSGRVHTGSDRVFQRRGLRARWNMLTRSAARRSPSGAGMPENSDRWRSSTSRVLVPHMGRSEDGPLVALHMICYYFMEAEARLASCA
jgi:D-sedoheptulose 7-phosphate isomerase